MSVTNNTETNTFTPEVQHRIDMFSEIAQAVFQKNQQYIADLHVFRKDKTVTVIDCEPFLGSYDSKLAMSFMVQYLCAMLDDVEFIVYASEAYMLEQSSSSTPEEESLKRDNIIKQYGSIGECPFSKEVMFVMYDDGENEISLTWHIETNDKGVKILDTSSEMTMQSYIQNKTFTDNILGSMLSKSKVIKHIADEIKLNISNDPDLYLPPDFNYFEASAQTISSKIQSEAPLVGFSLASNLYGAFKSNMQQEAIMQKEAMREHMVDHHEAPTMVM
jgi:hypothetical protein